MYVMCIGWASTSTADLLRTDCIVYARVAMAKADRACAKPSKYRKSQSALYLTYFSKFGNRD